MSDFHGGLDTIYGTEEEHAMGERLTDEQVAEALEVVRDWTDVHTCNDEGECSSCGADWPCQKGLVAPMVLQVSADLSAAKEALEHAESGVGTTVNSGDFKMADDTAYQLQGVLEDLRSARAALSSLRAHLPEAGR